MDVEKILKTVKFNVMFELILTPAQKMYLVMK